MKEKGATKDKKGTCFFSKKTHSFFPANSLSKFFRLCTGGSLIPTRAFFPVQAKTFMYKGHYRNKKNLLISSKVQELKKM